MKSAATLLLVAALGCSGEQPQLAHSLGWSPMNVPEAEKLASNSDDAEPTTQHMCGAVYWCCYRIGCPAAKLDKGRVWKMYDVSICPAQHEAPPTRHAAWHIWQPRIKDVLLYANGETRSQCVIQEATCSYEPQGTGICWSWPN